MSEFLVNKNFVLNWYLYFIIIIYIFKCPQIKQRIQSSCYISAYDKVKEAILKWSKQTTIL